MGLFGAICQSCSMPIGKDAEKGSEKDGSPSDEYCRLCYQHGQFIDPSIGVDEMALLVRSRMAEMGVPKLFARIFSRKVPKLKRWKRH